MEVLKGNKRITISKIDLESVISKYEKVVVDLGTGDGRFVVKSALVNPTTFYIGVDPSEKQLKLSTRDISRKKLENALLIVSSAENLPSELEGTADQVFVHFPWGSLLEAFAKPNELIIRKILKIIKPGGSLKAIFGYKKELEPSETERLDLHDIDLSYLNNILIPKYEGLGFKVEGFGEFDTCKEMSETTWSKRLKASKRDWFFIVITT